MQQYIEQLCMLYKHYQSFQHQAGSLNENSDHCIDKLLDLCKSTLKAIAMKLMIVSLQVDVASN